ncbi:nad5 (mitochondrion) [Candida theae]|uniref:Nad5 n=1 Tax=Candida theae TaxID=1198502 RepID=A0AAD5BC83_9ASCO|nr:nad5 [Candida theae]
MLLLCGLIAIVTNDIKKVIALSTMSQLSIMVLAIGISSYDLAIYHLYCHAFFKALLFMGAGSVIHSYISETQDMRKYGGLVNYLPFSYTAILIASLSLMAIPGLTGYYSKDIIIESLYGTYTFSGYILYYMAVGSATLTSLYSIRVLYLTFYNNPNSNKATYQHIHENIRLSLSLILVYIYEYAYKVRPSTVYNYFNNKIYYDQLLNNVIIRKTLIFGGYLNTYIDNGLLKVLGSTGISRALTYINVGIFLNILYLFFFL